MIKIFNGRYAVDRTGIVYSLVNNAGNTRSQPRPLKPHLNKDTGYYQVTCYIFIAGKKKRKLCLVHRLVAENFIPNPLNKPEVNHKNGIKSHNQDSNLEWTTVSENAEHAFKLGLRKPTRPMLGRLNAACPHSKPIKQLDLNGNLIQIFPSMAEAQRQGYNQGNIHAVIYGKRKSHKKCLWEFV